MTAHAQTLDGPFTDAGGSTFGFSVGFYFNGERTFRGTLDDVAATLSADPGGLSLTGTARVESIALGEPPERRAHVLGGDFFDVSNHPELTFASTSVELGEDGIARVEGDLTMAGTTRTVSARGTWRRAESHVAIDLETTLDRRDFGFAWQKEFPGGNLALAWEVALDVHLELMHGRRR